jgi:hypothetical protein
VAPHRLVATAAEDRLNISPITDVFPKPAPGTPIAVKPSGGVLVLANDTAVRLVPVKSSARNTIETVFCLRRNHISARDKSRPVAWP